MLRRVASAIRSAPFKSAALRPVCRAPALAKAVGPTAAAATAAAASVPRARSICAAARPITTCMIHGTAAAPMRVALVREPQRVVTKVSPVLPAVAVRHFAEDAQRTDVSVQHNERPARRHRYRGPTDLSNFFDGFPFGPMGRMFEWPDEDLGIRALSNSFDVSETDDKFVVSLDVPGVKKDDLKVTIKDTPEGKILRVDGERKSDETQPASEGQGRRRTHRYGSFSHSIRLTDTVDLKSIQASHEHGVLKITMSKISPSVTEQNIQIS